MSSSKRDHRRQSAGANEESAAQRFARTSHYLDGVSHARRGRHSGTGPEAPATRPADVRLTRSEVEQEPSNVVPVDSTDVSSIVADLKGSFQKELRNIQRWAVGFVIAGIIAAFSAMLYMKGDIKSDLVRAVEGLGQELRREISRLEDAQGDHESRLRQLERPAPTPSASPVRARK